MALVLTTTRPKGHHHKPLIGNGGGRHAKATRSVNITVLTQVAVVGGALYVLRDNTFGLGVVGALVALATLIRLARHSGDRHRKIDVTPPPVPTPAFGVVETWAVLAVVLTQFILEALRPRVTSPAIPSTPDVFRPVPALSAPVRPVWVVRVDQDLIERSDLLSAA